MHFSVIIPNLNSPIISETLTSLRRQSIDPAQFEVIVVGMDTPGLVQADDLIRFDRSEIPLSPAVARNRGAARARGSVLAFIDADCVASAGWLAVLARRFADPQVAVVGGGVKFEERGYWRIADNLGAFYEFMANRPAGERTLLPSLNLAIRRELFLEEGGFDERYPRPAGEDSDLTFRLKRRGVILHFEPRAYVMHQPPRAGLGGLLRHGFLQGKYSIKVDPRYAGHAGLPWPVRTRLGVILAAPLLALSASLRVFLSNPRFVRYWYTLPAIMLQKLAWCLGAAARPRTDVWLASQRGQV